MSRQPLESGRTGSRLLVVGDPFFLARHRPLTEALRRRLGDVAELEVHERALAQKCVYFARAWLRGRLRPLRRAVLADCLARFRKEPSTFARLSRLAERRIRRHRPQPAFVLQLFSMSSPAPRQSDLRYAHYVDMTMALVRREWPNWAPFESESAYERWIAREGATYRAARRVFTFTEATRRSVIDDYGVAPERVVAIGAAGHYDDIAPGARTYGNRTIVFNGSDFERKGGDRVLAAFRLVRQRFADATLTIVAYEDLPREAGLHLTGKISRTALFALFDRTDIVLAPTRLDMLAGFTLEAMSRGVVPVLSDAASMHEMIVDGKEGLIASPPSPERLAHQILALFTDPTLLETLGNAARVRVARDWNWDTVAGKMIDSLAERGENLLGES